jgi:hypothetical protein
MACAMESRRKAFTYTHTRGIWLPLLKHGQSEIHPF